MDTVYKTLEQLGIKDKPVITLFNKCDKFEELPTVKDLKAKYTINISAKTGENIDKLLLCIQDIIQESRVRIERCFAYSEAGKIQLIREYGQLESEEYTENGIEVKAYVPRQISDRL